MEFGGLRGLRFRKKGREVSKPRQGSGFKFGGVRPTGWFGRVWVG